MDDAPLRRVAAMERSRRRSRDSPTMERSRPGSTANLAKRAETFAGPTGTDADAIIKNSAVVARKHGAALQTALEKQMKVFEERFSSDARELMGVTAAAAASLVNSAAVSPVAAQAALASALEGCVERVAESESWIASVEMEVRQLRAGNNRSAGMLSSLAAQVEQLEVRASAVDAPTTQMLSGGEDRHQTPGESLQPSVDLSLEALLTLRMERLEAELRHLTFKLDAGDAELEHLRSARDDQMSRRELVDFSETLRRDVDGLRARTSLLEERAARSDGLDSGVEQLAEAIEPLAEQIEPLAHHLSQVAELAAQGEKNERGVEEARQEIESLKVDMRVMAAIGRGVGDELKMDRYERLFHDIRKEFNAAIAELSDFMQSLNLETKGLSEKVAQGSNKASHDELEAMTKLLREELKNKTQAVKQEVDTLSERISRGSTRQELQNATQLLLEVKDASKLLKEDPNYAVVELAVMRKEFINATELWRREFDQLAAQFSQHALVTSECKGTVTRQELTDIMDLLREEVEVLTKRVQRNENAVSRQEYTETVKALKQELIVIVNKAVHGDLLSRRQELIDAAELMKHEVKAFSEKGAVTQQDLASALEILKQELATRLEVPRPRAVQDSTDRLESTWLEVEPLVVRSFERLWRERVGVPEGAGVTLRQELRAELEQESVAARKDRERMDQHVRNLEDGVINRCVEDVSRLSERVRREVPALTQRVGKLEDGLINRCVDTVEDVSPLSEQVRREVSELRQRVGKLEVGRAIESEGESNGKAISIQLPALSLDHLSPSRDRAEQSSGDDMQNLEKIVKEMRKRIDTLSDANQRSPTPRGMGGEGVAQLMAAVKKDQEQERVVVEQLLHRIGSLCDRVVSVESRIKTAFESADSAPRSDGDVADLVEAKVSVLRTRLAALEAAAETAAATPARRQRRVATVADFLGPDFEPQAAPQSPL